MQKATDFLLMSSAVCPEYFTTGFRSDDSDPDNKLTVELDFNMYGGKV